MKNKTKGALLIIVPFVLLVFILSAWSITRFVASRMSNTQPAQIQEEIQTKTGEILFEATPTDLQELSIYETVARITNVVLGLLGILAVLGILVGLPFGIYYLAKKEEIENTQNPQIQEKYKNLTPEQITFINKWSWGAFFSFPVWVLGNGLYIWILASIVPFFNIYAWIKLSANGRKMAWEEHTWINFDQFKQRQKTMAWIIVLLCILNLVRIIVNISSL